MLVYCFVVGICLIGIVVLVMLGKLRLLIVVFERLSDDGLWRLVFMGFGVMLFMCIFGVNLNVSWWIRLIIVCFVVV